MCGWPENLCIRVGNTGNSAYRMQINLSGPLNQNNKKKEWLYSPNKYRESIFREMGAYTAV